MYIRQSIEHNYYDVACIAYYCTLGYNNIIIVSNLSAFLEFVMHDKISML